MSTHQTIETGTAVVAKATPPVTVSIATLAGYNVSELLVWATLIYTVLMIGHKVYAIVQEVRDRSTADRRRGDRRVGAPDPRLMPVERRGRT